MASSFHLFWQGVPRDAVEATATIEVIEPPTVDELYFWALQVSFRTDTRQTGGAHIGLQHHPSYPDSGAVNWGGYDDVNGGILEGTESELPSALGNANTRTYPWRPGRRYRYRVHRAESGWWAGEIADLDSGETITIRELNGHDADHLGTLMVWSEVFAPCTAPSAAVRWTDLGFTTSDGISGAPERLRINYQAVENHGCKNTNSDVDELGATQRTNTDRVNRQGTVVVWTGGR